MSDVQINWRSDGHLAPTGQLHIVTAEIEQNEHTVGPRILAEDEAGVQWLIEHLNFVCDMHPYKLPVPFAARYTVTRREKDNEKRYSGERYSVDATSMEEAITLIQACPDLHFYSVNLYEWVMDDDDLRALRPQSGKPPARNKR